MSRTDTKEIGKENIFYIFLFLPLSALTQTHMLLIFVTRKAKILENETRKKKIKVVVIRRTRKISREK